MTARKAMYALDMLTGRLVPVRGHKAKSTGPSIEWDVRCLNNDGDAMDVRHYDTKPAALSAAKRIACSDEYPAVVVERHDLRMDEAGDVCASYTTVATFGDASVVALWEGGAL